MLSSRLGHAADSETLGKTPIGSWTLFFSHPKCLMKNLKIFYAFWSWNLSRNKNRKRSYFFPATPRLCLSFTLSVHLCISIWVLFSFLHSFPLASFLWLPLSLCRSLIHYKISVSAQLDCLMLSDLDFMWVGRISALVFIRISFLSAQKYLSK